MKWTKQQTLGVLLLWIVVLSVSSAATAFDFIEVPNPFLKACWRLQITTIICALVSILEWKNRRDDWITMWREAWYLIILSGIWLGCHFSAWTWSLDLTSMAHSLLFVCSGSILTVLYTLMMWKRIKLITIVGTVIGFAGIAVTAFAPFKNLSGNVAGDFVALFGALSIIVYLKIGEYMRKIRDIPLSAYLTGVNGTAAITSYVIAVI